MSSNIKTDILELVQKHPLRSSKELYDELHAEVGYATVKRLLNQLLAEDLIITKGKGKGTKYEISPSYELLHPINVSKYFEQEQDERRIKESFELALVSDVLWRAKIFNDEERAHLGLLHEKFKKNIAGLSETEYNKEMERLAIDLSWKSSQIEGNTYTLLETERLLKEKETAEGKPKDDATMFAV